MRLRSFMFSSILGLAAAANGWALDQTYNLPPAQMLMEPGPGVAGPGPGVLPPAIPPMMAAAMACQETQVQILFNRPEGMQVRWDVSGVSMFDSDPLIVPGRQNFPEAGIYRLKLTNIPGQEGVELYPTLEIGPTTPRTEAYLAHNAIPIQFTDEDFQQVLVGNFVTKVIYLPDPEFQELALAGVETLVSTRLDPGVDPVVEADRRGAIMAVLRLGNKDLEMADAAGAGGVTPASFAGPAGAPCGPNGCPVGMDGVGVPGMPGPPMMPNYVAGVTAPTWGYPITGTPIGLPGPPHIPLGHPAGLQKHVIRNHTVQHIPGPVERFNIHVRQQPGYSYPKPPSHMWIREQNIYPSVNFRQPLWNRTQVVPQAGVPGSGTALFGQPAAGQPYCP